MQKFDFNCLVLQQEVVIAGLRGRLTRMKGSQSVSLFSKELFHCKFPAARHESSGFRLFAVSVL